MFIQNTHFSWLPFLIKCALDFSQKLFTTATAVLAILENENSKTFIGARKRPTT